MNKYTFILIQIISGFIAADLLSGLFHWFEDTYLDYCINIPILSDISKDNELHHYFPRSILAYSYLEQISVTLPLTIAVVVIVYICFPKWAVKHYAFMISLFIFGSVSNLIHRFSHMRACEIPFPLNVIQYTGILCSHDHHSMHHTLINEKYCVISEYSNHILDNIGFWRGLEMLIYLVSGIHPSRKQTYDDYIEIHNHMHDNAKLECPDLPTLEQVNELKIKLRNYKHCHDTA